MHSNENCDNTMIARLFVFLFIQGNTHTQNKTVEYIEYQNFNAVFPHVYSFSHDKENCFLSNYYYFINEYKIARNQIWKRK